MARVLVTGGAGYIGAHACKALAQAGHQPVVFDSLDRGWRDAVRWGPLVVGDVRDRSAIETVFAEHSPKAVMHFAALAYVGESASDPTLYYQTNIGGAMNVFDVAARSGAPVVFSSTCATYGVPASLPITEAEPQRPINPYGFTKLAAERGLKDLEAAHDLRWAALRYFNAAGADSDGEIGERHEPETHVIPLAIEAALGGQPLTVFGDDYDTPDGSCLRDYIHVEDLAAAHVAALEALIAGEQSFAVNLGVGRGYSVFEIIDAVEKEIGRRPSYSIGARREGDPPALVAATNAALEQLGWRAQHDLQTIVKHAVAWRMAHGRHFFENAGGKSPS